jgi:hypothetical protein
MTGIDAVRTSLKENTVAAVWAILTVVVVFSLLNLIEYRRID